MAQTLLETSQINGLSTIVKNQVYIPNGNTQSNHVFVANLNSFLGPEPVFGDPGYYGTASDDFTFIEGERTYLTSVADNGSGQCRFYVEDGHPYASGDPISIYSSVAGYNLTPVITYIDSTHFDVPIAYSATANGFMWRGARLKCNIPPYYKHNLSATVYAKGATGETLTLGIRNKAGSLVEDAGTAMTTGTFKQLRVDKTSYDIAENDEIFFYYRYSAATSVLFESLVFTVQRIY